MRGFHMMRSALAGAVLVGVARFAAAEGGPPPEIQAAEQAAFAEADTDGSGNLTAAELANFEEIMRAKMAALHFARIDADGDGAVTLAELQAGKHGGPGSCGPGRRF